MDQNGFSFAFSEKYIEESVNKLKEYLPDEGVNNGILFQIEPNTVITSNYTRLSLKRIRITGNHFLKSSFHRASLNGSKLSFVHYDNCDLSNSSFQYCYFNTVRFTNGSSLENTNFIHSAFVDCEFEDVSIIASAFNDCYFENCSFTRCKIQSSAFENAIFQSCVIVDIDLAHTNLEYSRMNNVSMRQVILPPYQIPYIIGGPDCLSNNHQVEIYSDRGDITAAKYRELFEELSAYFYSQSSFFPLSNLFIGMKRKVEAMEFILAGVKDASHTSDFRMIKHYCRLVCSNHLFSSADLRVIYEQITQLSYDSSWDVYALHSYMQNIGEIRELLLNNSERKHRVEFVLKTDIAKDDLKSVNGLYSLINDVIKSNSTRTHIDFIEVRHNSPYELYVTLIDNLPQIMLVIYSMYGLFSLSSKALDFLKKIQDVISTHQQIKLQKMELEEKRAEIERKCAEQRSNLHSGIITNYSIVELEHLLKCNSIDAVKGIQTEFLHYKIVNRE